VRLSHTSAARAQAHRRGLSLLEVILSLAILVISMTALGLLINQGSEHEMQARLNNTGTRLAQSKLAEVEAGIVSFDTMEGDFGEGDPGWSWTMNAEDQGANLWLVTITVTRDLRGQPFQLSLGQMMLDPSILGSAAKLTRPTTASTGGSP
jgi:general secretion pathway protein I